MLNPFKKLYNLLFKNVNSQLFKDVAAHYQALSKAGRNNECEKKMHFYVSSEWNLYRF
jgi:hypothetical protein